MIFREGTNFKDNERKIAYIFDYHPYWETPHKVKNPLFNRFGKLILDVKEGNEEAIEKFAEYLHLILEENIAVSVVPPHDVGNFESGIQQIARIIASQNRIDATRCLLRTKETTQQSHDGKKKWYENKNSITANETELIKNRPVILIDDIVTSGNSLITCRNILKRSRAGIVQCLALGKTIREEAPKEYKKEKSVYR